MRSLALLAMLSLCLLLDATTTSAATRTAAVAPTFSSPATPKTKLGLGEEGLIAAGEGHTCALVAGGARCWGDDYYGELGDGRATLDPQATPVSATGLLAAGVTRVWAGGSTSCAQVDGTLKCWGYNQFGQLATGTSSRAEVTPTNVTGLNTQLVSLSMGTWHVCGIDTQGAVWCWGDAEDGQLGNGATGTGIHITAPVAVSGLTNGVQSVAAGGDHSCAVTSSGDVMCWGGNLYGELGVAPDNVCRTVVQLAIPCRSTPVQVVGLRDKAVAVAAGNQFTCALTTGAALKCWGNNESGQLGDGTTDNRTQPVAVQGLGGAVAAVALGSGHACALIADESVKCWGNNQSGQLGDGTTVNSTMPRDVVGLQRGVVAIAVGGDHSCALLLSGDIKCWGDNGHGQLGDGTTDNRTQPVEVVSLSVLPATPVPSPPTINLPGTGVPSPKASEHLAVLVWTALTGVLLGVGGVFVRRRHAIAGGVAGTQRS